jgi:DNA-binding MarR family transcriptional regulator
VQFVLLASLWWLSEHADATPSQRELAEQAGTDAMMTSQVLRKLEARKLVVREADEHDARARRLRLTPAGAKVLSGALADVEAADATYFQALGADRGAFLDGLARLAGA